MMDSETIIACAKELCGGCRKELPFVERGRGYPTHAAKMHTDNGFETFCPALPLLKLLDSVEKTVYKAADSPQELHRCLASTGIRVFKIYLGRDETTFWIHPNKTTEAWREDLSNFVIETTTRDSSNGWADSLLMDKLFKYMHGRGYIEMDDVVSDVYEGRIANMESMILPDPQHENDESGFGHYGWESNLK
jgi:hypothetical protein